MQKNRTMSNISPQIKFNCIEYLFTPTQTEDIILDVIYIKWMQKVHVVVESAYKQPVF